MTIIAAADGSALGNPGPAGWAWYVDEDRWQAGGWPRGTNNQGELMAVIALLDATAHLDEEILVHCDSQYVINSVTKWMPGWKRRGWRKADGSPVLNRELLERLDEALRGRRVSFEWVKGHAGHELNEAADLHARAVATAYQDGSEPPTGPGWPGASSPPPPLASSATTTAPELFAADDLELVAESDALDTVIALERSLLDPAVRTNPERVDELLHPLFAEIGHSGRLLPRDEVIDALGREYGSEISFDLVSAELLTSDTVLLVFQTARKGQRALRSSLWLREEGRWQVRFHQGTPA